MVVVTIDAADVMPIAACRCRCRYHCNCECCFGLAVAFVVVIFIVIVSLALVVCYYHRSTRLIVMFHSTQPLAIRTRSPI